MGGRLIRSMGGWSHIISMRRLGERKLGDEWIVREVDENVKGQLKPYGRKNEIAEVVQAVCKKKGIHVQELKAGGKIGVPQGGPFSPLATNI